MATSPSNANAGSPFNYVTADSVKQLYLLELARRFKGTDAEVDRRIDENAAYIMGRPDLSISMIPATVKGAPRVPFYLEGEPGVGKTSVIKDAILEFCDLTGLNFIENPPDGYKITDKDFYYAVVNLSGKSNTMDLGGIPTKNALDATIGAELRMRSANTGAWLMAELESRARAVSHMSQLELVDAKHIVKGNLSSCEMTIIGEADRVDLVIKSLCSQLGEDVKKRGVGLSFLREGEEPQDGRLYLQVKKGNAGARITAWTPNPMNLDNTFVSEMLPNRRFAMAATAKFCLFNFDDVANSSEAVRNVLLEVAQSNRYSGVMDLGNAMVSFTGNMGADDNTNTQSEQSDAEVTRVAKMRITDTPKDWARRTATKYSSEGGDCHFAAFIEKYGNEPGVFREPIGDGRSAKGIPKPNSRSLENALSMALPYFQMARSSNLSPTVFSKDIEGMVKSTAGANVATRYISFMQAMEAQAIPLADNLLATGKLDEVALNKFMGAGAKASDRDFAFRFGVALADAFVYSIAYSDGARSVSSKPEALAAHISESVSRMCTGLAQLDPGTMNNSLSRVMARLANASKFTDANGTSATLKDDITISFADGFADSVNRGVWASPEQAKSDFLTMVSGNTNKTTRKVMKP